MKFVRPLLVAATLALVAVPLSFSFAYAEAQPPVKTVDWALPAGSDQSDVQWPQYLAGGPNDPGCGRWVQVDRYSYDQAHQAEVDALIAGGVLQDMLSDQNVVIDNSWTFYQEPACQQPTPTPTPTPTPAPTPTSTPTPPPPPSHTTTPPPPTPTPDAPPPSRASTTSTTGPAVDTAGDAPGLPDAGHPPGNLTETGAPHLWLPPSGLAIAAVGMFIAAFAARRYASR